MTADGLHTACAAGIGNRYVSSGLHLGFDVDINAFGFEGVLAATNLLTVDDELPVAEQGTRRTAASSTSGGGGFLTSGESVELAFDLTVEIGLCGAGSHTTLLTVLVTLCIDRQLGALVVAIEIAGRLARGEALGGVVGFVARVLAVVDALVYTSRFALDVFDLAAALTCRATVAGAGNAGVE